MEKPYNPAQEGIVAAKMDAIRDALKEIESVIEGHLNDDDENELSTEDLIESAFEIWKDLQDE